MCEFLLEFWLELLDGDEPILAVLVGVGGAVEGADEGDCGLGEEDVAGAALVDGLGHGFPEVDLHGVIDVVVDAFGANKFGDGQQGAKFPLVGGVEVLEVVLDPEGAVHVAAGDEELADLFEGGLIDDILLDEADFLFFLLHADLNFFELG